MSELFFVLRCFLATIFITFLMQIKISGVPLEARANGWIRTSYVTAYLQDAAAGGALVIKDAYINLKRFVSDSVSSIGKSESQDKR